MHPKHRYTFTEPRISFYKNVSSQCCWLTVTESHVLEQVKMLQCGNKSCTVLPPVGFALHEQAAEGEQ